MNPLTKKAAGLFFAVALVASACGSTETSVAGESIDPDLPTVVVTTNILGDVVRNIVGDQMNVEVIMPVGADPHDFQASAQQVTTIGEADAMIVNGANFEEGLIDVIWTAREDGVETFEAIDVVQTLEFDGEDVHDDDEEEDGHDDEEEDGHDDEEEDGHDDEEEDGHDDEEDGHDDDEDGHGHDEGGVDPHFFTDPSRVALAAGGIADFLIEHVEGIDADALTASADAYVDELNALDSEIADVFAGIDADDRILVTNHEVFAYMADRYGFEVVGTVIPATSTGEGVSAQELVELAEVISHEGVPAIFADTSSSSELAETLAAEVGDVEVVELFSESLGDADSEGATYTEMVRTNADRIASALS